jgi:hypothetical protein
MLDADDLGPADRKMLKLLREGRVTAPYAAEKEGYSLQYVRDVLTRLVEHGHARKIHTGLYEFVSDPRREWVNDLSEVTQVFIEFCSLDNREGPGIASNFEKGVEQIQAVADEDDHHDLQGALLWWAVSRYGQSGGLKRQRVNYKTRELLERYGYDTSEADDAGE